jgi:twitching motility protein PilT
VARDDVPVPRERAEAMVLAALAPEQRAELERAGQLDLAYAVPGVGRFRVNAFRQQSGLDAVFRHVPPEPPSLEDLGLPPSLAKFTNYHQGMVLLTGPANCGKSSTLAALVRILNEERRDHILTIEDPIEFVHASQRCIVNQRSVGHHTGSFARALRAALREDPDVIVVGELRDFETVSLALTAAETGHLVLGTLHTNGAIRTINRIVGVFPADQQEQVRSMVSESLRAVVSQRLVTNTDASGRVPALEILVVNKAVGNLIRENKTFQIHSQLQMGASQGMCLLDDSLNRLVKEKAITREEALRHAEDPKRITG